jgi:hypothetical protein
MAIFTLMLLLTKKQGSIALFFCKMRAYGFAVAV